ncbi:hypothetical protein [Halopiger djelfimassiliensis]|uniref:hypothetical protein n=1 Tax=Halopiger djelfimassiliensis TaxID=1293047 RepID=UPI000677FF41|nr:hypothetical protein [Halopiger djelfimassiliensis]
MTTLDRRTTLCLLGTGTAALAGCSETTDDTDGATQSDPSGSDGDPEPTIDGDGNIPPYASIFPRTDRSESLYGTIDVGTMRSLLEDEPAAEGEEPTDPLVRNPVVMAFRCLYGLGVLGNTDGYPAYNEHNETTDGEETFIFADGVYALVGRYDFDGVTAALESAGYVPETAEETYAVYTTDSGGVVGVTDEVYAFVDPTDDSVSEPVATVERTVATATGGQEPKHETDEAFERLLRLGRSDGITVCLSAADEFSSTSLETLAETDEDAIPFAFDAFDGATGVHQHLSIENEDATARAVVTFEESIDADRLEAELGSEADSTTVVRDDTAVSVEAEYAGDFGDG